MFTRVLMLLIGLLCLAGIWLDPFTYTMHPAGPELAPALWKGVVVLDTAILLWFLWNVAMANWLRAYVAIGISIMFSLTMNAVYVRIRGVDRFLIIFQTDEILYLYFLVIALRVLALFVCGASYMRIVRRDVTPDT
jgi:hypothetical protein